jgi:hypothetical protein
MNSRRYPLSTGDVPLPTNITITTSPPSYVSNILASRRPTAPPPLTTAPPFPSASPASSYPPHDTGSDRLHNFPTPNLSMYTHTFTTPPNSRQEVAASSSTGGAPPHFFSPYSTTTTSTMFTPPMITTLSGVEQGDMAPPIPSNGANTTTLNVIGGNVNNVSGSQSLLDSHTPYITTPTTSTPPQAALAKVPLFFLHPVPNSNVLTVMKCMQPVAQDILIDSREVSPFLPLLGCFFICTMEEREILSIFPMSKPILRWGIYHKGNRNLLFSSFYRFNCAFGAKGYFTYPL